MKLRLKSAILIILITGSALIGCFGVNASWEVLSDTADDAYDTPWIKPNQQATVYRRFLNSFGYPAPVLDIRWGGPDEGKVDPRRIVLKCCKFADKTGIRSELRTKYGEMFELTIVSIKPTIIAVTVKKNSSPPDAYFDADSSIFDTVFEMERQSLYLADTTLEFHFGTKVHYDPGLCWFSPDLKTSLLKPVNIDENEKVIPLSDSILVFRKDGPLYRISREKRSIIVPDEQN